MKLAPPNRDALLPREMFFNRFALEGSAQQMNCSHRCNEENLSLETAVEYFEGILEGNGDANIRLPITQNVFIFGDYFKEGNTYCGSFNKIGNVGKQASVLSHNLF